MKSISYALLQGATVFALLGGLIPAVLPEAQAAENAIVPETLTTERLRDLLPALRKGGYVLYFRHGSTRTDQEDVQPVNLADCTKQRNLSDDGRAQMKRIGKAVRTMKIPVDKVISSPFCRAKESASLAFGNAEVSDVLFFAIGLSKVEREVKGAILRKMFGQPPAKGKNTIIIGHSANLDEATTIWPKPEGVAIIFKPDNQRGYAVIGRVEPDVWGDAAGSAR